MSIVSTLRKWVLGGDAPLNDIEVRLLREIGRHLSEASRKRWDAQINCVNLVQRLDEGKEVNLYCMRRGKPAFDSKLKFGNLPAEVRVASAILGRPKDASSIAADVWLANGRLFSILYTESPRQLFSQTDNPNHEPSIMNLSVFIDPETGLPPVC